MPTPLADSVPYWYLEASAGTAKSGQWVVRPNDHDCFETITDAIRTGRLPRPREWPNPPPVFTWDRLVGAPDVAWEPTGAPRIVSESLRRLILAEGKDVATFFPVRLRGPNSRLLTQSYWFAAWKRAWRCQTDPEDAELDASLIPTNQRIGRIDGSGWWSGGNVVIRNDLKTEWSKLGLVGIRFRSVPLAGSPETLVRVKDAATGVRRLIQRRLIPDDKHFDIEAFLGAGGDPNGPTDVPNSTAFHSYVVMHSAMGTLDARVVRKFLRAGGNPNVGFGPNVSALLVVIEPKTPALIRLLAKHGADFNVRNSLNGYTPLMSAVASSSLATVRAMIAAGADPNFPDLSGWTPLDHAMEELQEGSLRKRGANAVLRVLAEAGARPGARSQHSGSRRARPVARKRQPRVTSASST